MVKYTYFFNVDAFVIARRRQKMTIKKVAAKVGVSTTTMSKYENGHVTMPTGIIEKLLSLYQLKPADIFVTGVVGDLTDVANA